MRELNTIDLDIEELVPRRVRIDTACNRGELSIVCSDPVTISWNLLTDDSPVNTVSSLVAALEEDDEAYPEPRCCPKLRHGCLRYAEKIFVRDALHDNLICREGAHLLVSYIMVERSDVLL